jgi:NAD(P)-dependent dehydrogenase (short-subunit alcohol dehydrogenase family)
MSSIVVSNNEKVALVTGASQRIVDAAIERFGRIDT